MKTYEIKTIPSKAVLAKDSIANVYKSLASVKTNIPKKEYNPLSG